MADTRMYSAPGLDLQHLSDALASWLRTQDMETQAFPTPGGVTVQARKTSFMQHGVALTAMLMQNGDNLQVQVGTGKWAMHAVEGVAAAILFWPLLAIPAYSAFKLKETMDDTWSFLDRYVAAGGNIEVPSTPMMGMGAPMMAPAAPAAAKAPAVEEVKCPQCGEPVKIDAKFCANCGAKLQHECVQCGAALRPDAKFCDNCGAKVEV